jgi:hypothetical protein
MEAAASSQRELAASISAKAETQRIQVIDEEDQRKINRASLDNSYGPPEIAAIKSNPIYSIYFRDHTARTEVPVTAKF